MFTKDCIVNLDDLGEMEDYRQLLKDANQMLSLRRCDDAIFKRLIDSEVDYLFQ